MGYNRNIFLVFLLLLLTGYSGCTASMQPKFPHGIILISIDTLRADHLGIYGYHRNTSPYMDTFAKESIVFEDALVQSSWTLPSHMSIMTSLYPSFHGVRLQSYPLAEDHTTLAELLKKGGYQTAAFVDGGWVSAVFGFDRGFDIYDDEDQIGIAKILPKVKIWLTKNKGKPFFLFIHCYDVHDPYDPPPPYDNIFHNFSYTGNFVPNTENLQAAEKGDWKVNDEDLQHIIALYDGGIRYTDKKIGNFLSYLKEAGLYEQSLIIITSDHGEEFKEHNSLLHWQLYYRPNLQVPLILHIPNYPREGKRIKEPVQSIDLLPTILEIAQLPPHNKAQGKSLIPLIKGYTNLQNKNSTVSFAEHHGTHVAGKYVFTHEISIITNDGYQMIYNLKRHSTQLYNLNTDPLAQINIATNHNILTRRLLSDINKLLSAVPDHKPSTISLDKKIHKQLKALGYLQ